MIIITGHNIDIDEFTREVKTIHLGRNPRKGGRPPRENSRIIKDIVYAGLLYLIEILGAHCLEDMSHKRDIIAIDKII